MSAHLGYYLDEDAYNRIERAAVLADLLADTFGECLGPGGEPVRIDSRRIAVLGEHLLADLRAGMDACQWGRWAAQA